MAAAAPLSLLFLFTFLTTISTTTVYQVADPSHSSRSATNFISSSCKATEYPALCYHCLSGYAKQIQQNERQLCLTALAISLKKAKSATKFVASVSKSKGIKHREYEAVKDCMDTMSDSVDQLTRSFMELGHMGRTNDSEDFMWHMSNVQTWVSAALTDTTTCMDGFSSHAMSGHVKGAINMRLTNVAQVTSNALALVNRFAART